jgi:hypothetical protein
LSLLDGIALELNSLSTDRVEHLPNNVETWRMLRSKQSLLDALLHDEPVLETFGVSQHFAS